MNEITINNIKEERARRSMSDQLECLWLLSALREGIEQAEAGKILAVDEAFFARLIQRIGSKGDQPIV